MKSFFPYLILIFVVFNLLGGCGVIAASSDLYANNTKVIVSNIDISAMLVYGERIVLRESIADKKNHVAEYISCTTEEFSEIVQNQLPDALDKRADIEIELCRLAQLYVLESEYDYACKVYDALIKLANNHFEIKKNNTTSYFIMDGYTLHPIYPAIAYSLLGDFSVQEFDTLYQTDTQKLIESWLYDTAEITYNQFTNYTAGNLTGFTVKHMAGIAKILNEPLIMRWAIFIADQVMVPELWHADGMWWEGTLSYSQQVTGNLKEALPLISGFVDPEGYNDTLLGLKLDGTDISSRYPMLKHSPNELKKVVNPDGTVMAVHDTHPTYSSVVGKNLPIKEEYLNNVELNHFGLFALKSGNTENAQQVSLLFPPMLAGGPFGGGHCHGNFLTMTLWAAGQELLPDAGYPFQTANHRFFHMSPVTHNGAFIWDGSVTSHVDYAYLSSRPNLLRYDDGTESGGNIQLIEAQQLMSEDIGVKDKRRLLMQIKTSQNTSYVFDLQTLAGGDVHENFLRASEDEGVEVITESTKIKSVDNLGTYLKNNGDGGLLPLQTLFTDADIYSGDNINFSFVGDTSGARLNAFVKGVEGSSAAFSSMPSLRRTGGDSSLRDDFPTKHFYQRREVSGDEVTRFAAVYEGLSATDNAYIDNVSWYETADAVFALIDMGEFEDIICISDDLTKKEFEGIIFKSGIGWVRRTKNDKKVASGYIYGGGKIYTDFGTFSCKDNFESNIKSVNQSILGKNAVELNDDLPEELVGKWANITFSDGSGLSFKLTDVDGKTAFTHNDVGFEFADRKSTFTAFPAKQNAEGSLWVGVDTKLDTLLNRSINGDVKFQVNSSFYGAPEIYMVITENNMEFESLKTGGQYIISGYADEDFMIYAVVFKNNNVYKVFSAKKGEKIEFTPDEELFKPDENGEAPDVYIECMLWDKKLAPLCNKRTLR